MSDSQGEIIFNTQGVKITGIERIELSDNCRLATDGNYIYIHPYRAKVPAATFRKEYVLYAHYKVIDWYKHLGSDEVILIDNRNNL